MTIEEQRKPWRTVLHGAIHAETLHLSAFECGARDETRDPGELLQEILNEGAGSMVGAMLGAAAQYAHKHPHADDPELRRMAGDAENVVASLPARLHRLWEMHYVEGHSLSVYAASAGLDEAAAGADYAEILRELVRLLPGAPADELSTSGVRRAGARNAEPCLSA